MLIAIANPKGACLRLLLFDIDMTLINSGPVGTEAMNRAFETVFGISGGFDGILLHGKTDKIIYDEGLEKSGIAFSQDTAEEFKTEYIRCLTEDASNNSEYPYVLPGVVELLNKLRTMTDIHIGILTGNWSQGARIKIASAGLSRFFGPIGGYAEDGQLRHELLPVAVKRLGERTGWHAQSRNVVIIGDTPCDIDVATHHNAVGVGVATGSHSFDELTEAGADRVFEDITDTDQVTDYLACIDPGSK